MNRENAKKFLPLITAFSEGKTIQILENWDGNEVWKDLRWPDFMGDPKDYRIKLEPKEFWINVYANEKSTSPAHPSRYLADQAACSDRIKCIHVREVV